MTPLRCNLRCRSANIFAETPAMSLLSSVKQRPRSRRYQITCAVHVPASRRMHSFSGHCEGGGARWLLRLLTITATYQMVTPFRSRAESNRAAIHLYGHEQQQQTDGIDYRGVERHRARPDPGFSERRHFTWSRT